VKLIDFIFAARPMLQLPVWSIYLISWHYIHSGADFGVSGLVVLAALTLNFTGAYYINQVYDYETDLINKKLGFLQNEMISRKGMIRGYYIVTVIAVVMAFAVDLLAGLISIIIAVLGFVYSAPPLRLKDRPFRGLFANSVAYGLLIPLAVPGLTYLWGSQTVYIPVYFFLTVSAGYLLTIIPDREGDIKSGKITFAALLPVFYLMMIAMLLLYLSLIAAIRMEYFLLSVLSAVAIVFFLIAMIYRKSPVILFACKTPILMMSLLAGYYYPGYLIFLLAVLLTTRLYYRRRFGIVYPKLN